MNELLVKKDKEGILVTSERLDQSGRKPNKMRAEKGNEIYNKSMKSWLRDNDI